MSTVHGTTESVCGQLARAFRNKTTGRLAVLSFFCRQFGCPICGPWLVDALVENWLPNSPLWNGNGTYAGVLGHNSTIYREDNGGQMADNPRSEALSVPRMDLLSLYDVDEEGTDVGPWGSPEWFQARDFIRKRKTGYIRMLVDGQPVVYSTTAFPGSAKVTRGREGLRRAFTRLKKCHVTEVAVSRGWGPLPGRRKSENGYRDLRLSTWEWPSEVQRVAEALQESIFPGLDWLQMTDEQVTRVFAAAKCAVRDTRALIRGDLTSGVG